MKTELYPVVKGADSLYFSGNKTGILLCHGFNGTPQSMEYIGKQLAKLGYTVSIPRLKGHGTNVEDMKNCIYNEWISDLQLAFAELKKNCDHVFAVGQSMGGALTIQLAANTNMNGIFLINAAVIDVAYKQYRDETKPKMIEEGEPDIKKPAVHEITYESVPLEAVHQLLDLMDDTKNKIKYITTPTVIFKSSVDHVVPPANSDFIYQQISSAEKKIIELKNSYHVASMDYDAQLIVDNINQHIQSLNAGISVTELVNS